MPPEDRQTTASKGTTALSNPAWLEQLFAYLPKARFEHIAASDFLTGAIRHHLPSATITPLRELTTPPDGQRPQTIGEFDLVIVVEHAGENGDPPLPADRYVSLLTTNGIVVHDRAAHDGLPGAAADLLDRVVYDVDRERRILEVRVADRPLPDSIPSPSHTVAVVVANYNYGRYLREAIQSLEEQFLPPDEVVVIDDASTDDSEIVLAELEAHGYRVVRNTVNLGPVETFRKAISLTRSDLVFVLGADNRLRPDYISRSVAALEQEPGCAVAYSDMLLFGGLAGKLAASTGATHIGRSTGENWDVFRWRLPPPTPDVLATFAERNFVGGSSMFRRDAYEAVGGYRKVTGPEDHDLFYRIWKAGGGLAHIPACLLEYRQHSPAQANTVLGLALENRALKDRLGDEATTIRALRTQISELKATIAQLQHDTSTSYSAVPAADENAQSQHDQHAEAAHGENLPAKTGQTSAAAEHARRAAQLKDIARLARSIEKSAIWPLLRLARSTRRRIVDIRRRAES